MRRSVVVAIAVLLGWAAIAGAQPAPKDLRGKVTLRGGQTYQGVIQTAEFGVVEGAGIGTERSLSNEYLAVDSGGQVVKVPVGDISTVEADWQQAGTEGAKKWQIATLTITRKDGTKVAGKVQWLLHESTVTVLQDDGTIARAHAFPVANPDFDPSQLLAKIELGAAAAPGGTAPAPTTPTAGGTAPAPTTPPAGGTAPAPTTPPGGGTAPAPTTPPAGGTAPAPTTPPVLVAGPSGTALMQITIVCPKCGEKIVIEIPVIAKSGGQ